MFCSSMKLYGQILTWKWKPSSPFYLQLLLLLLWLSFPFISRRALMLFISMAAEKVFDRQCAGEWWRVVCPTTIDGQASRRNVYINALLHETTHTADAYPAQRRWWWWRQTKKKYRDLSNTKRLRLISQYFHVSHLFLDIFLLTWARIYPPMRFWSRVKKKQERKTRRFSSWSSSRTKMEMLYN